MTIGSETSSNENHGLVPRRRNVGSAQWRETRGAVESTVAESESQSPGMCFLLVCQVPSAGRKTGCMNARPFALCHPLHCHCKRHCYHKPNERVAGSYDCSAGVDASVYPGTGNAIKSFNHTLHEKKLLGLFVSKQFAFWIDLPKEKRKIRILKAKEVENSK